MTREDKFKWMAEWCAKNGAALNLEGECGFGRECVGILVGDTYPDYQWYDVEGDYERLDKNGDIWTPKDAYHKHECVAVLGRGEEAEDQLYQWLKWFDDNGFKIESGFNKMDKPMHPIEMLLGKHKYQRMVRAES